MRAPRSNCAAAGATLPLAAVLWFAAFALDFGSFWIKISLSAATLALLALALRPPLTGEVRFVRRALLEGAAWAAILYGVFWTGREVALRVFPFAGPQIGEIYRRGAGTPGWIVALVLLSVTGPSEEIYWRGFLQRCLMERLGRRAGWALATASYAAVHICSLNFMLVGAAAVAGAFWGALYARRGELAPVIVSHSLWSAAIFAFFPMDA